MLQNCSEYLIGLLYASSRREPVNYEKVPNLSTVYELQILKLTQNHVWTPETPHFGIENQPHVIPKESLVYRCDFDEFEPNIERPQTHCTAMYSGSKRVVEDRSTAYCSLPPVGAFVFDGCHHSTLFRYRQKNRRAT